MTLIYKKFILTTEINNNCVTISELCEHVTAAAVTTDRYYYFELTGQINQSRQIKNIIFLTNSYFNLHHPGHSLCTTFYVRHQIEGKIYPNFLFQIFLRDRSN